MVFQLQTNSPSKLKKSWFFKNIFFLYEFLSKIQIGFDYHRTWWYQFFRYFLCKIFSPEISCDFDLSSSRSSLRSLAENMKRYMVLVFWTSDLMDFWSFGLLALRISGLPDFWTSGLLAFRASGLLSWCPKNVLI